MTHRSEGGTDHGDRSVSSDSHWRQVTQRHYDPDGEGELTTALVFAIADAADADPTALKSPTLYDTVDVAAIEAAFFGRETRAGDRQGAGTVGFRYLDFLVTVGSDGWIQVAERTETKRP